MHKQWNIGMGIVSDCNMNCEFCYSKAKRNSKKDLKLEDWISFIDHNYNYIGTINYGTGENALSSDWFTLIDYIRTNFPNIKQALTTNGYVSEAMRYDARKLSIVQKSIDEIDVSIDFADKNSHNNFRGQKKAYDWAISTLEFCQKNKKSATIVCLGSKINAYPENLSGLFYLAHKYNAILRMNLYRPTEGIDDFAQRFILPSQELVSILRWISKNYTILSISDTLFSNLLTEHYEVDPSGIDSLRILPDGKITPSTYLIQEDFIVGNISEGEILKKLEEDNIIDRIIYEIIPKECNGCRYVSTCKGGVYDRRYLWNKTLEKKDPYCFYQPGTSELEKITVSSMPFHSVHHGYLPTMFFSSKHKEDANR